jgi:hypothetical protein
MFFMVWAAKRASGHDRAVSGTPGAVLFAPQQIPIAR